MLYLGSLGDIPWSQYCVVLSSFSPYALIIFHEISMEIGTWDDMIRIRTPLIMKSIFTIILSIGLWTSNCFLPRASNYGIYLCYCIGYRTNKWLNNWLKWTICDIKQYYQAININLLEVFISHQTIMKFKGEHTRGDMMKK